MTLLVALWLTGIGLFPLSGAEAPPSPTAAATNATPSKPNPVPAATTNPPAVTNPPAPPDPKATPEAAEAEFKSIMMEDDKAQDDVEKMIQDNEAFAAKGAGLPEAELRQKTRDRFEPVRKAYEDFIKRHPEHARARVAFAAFLGDLGEQDAAQEHLQRALTLSPKDPAIYNNLAKVYGHIGPIRKAFEYYAKAIELSPEQPKYYHNLGNTLFLFPKDAADYYHLPEPQVYEKALTLYSNAVRLDPDNFPLASDVAQAYYGVRPFPVDRALGAWTNALHIAHDELEREGVLVHFARIDILASRFAEAQAHLDGITNDVYLDLKKHLSASLAQRRNSSKPASTNTPPPAPKPPAPSTNAPATPTTSPATATNPPPPTPLPIAPTNPPLPAPPTIPTAR